MPDSEPPMTYWAHSDPNGLSPNDPNAHWQLLSEHLSNVGQLAKNMAAEAAPADIDFALAAQTAGLLHDLGKYTDCFQKMIRTRQGRCPHAAHGAYVANEYGRPDASFAIVGHHSGIPDRAGEHSWRSRLKDAKEEASAILPNAQMELPTLLSFTQRKAELGSLNPANFDLRTRLLFSCLVDADRLDSAGLNSISPPLMAGTRLAKVLEHLHKLQTQAGPSVVASAREQVLTDCLEAAQFSERLLSLTVPTGGGKTLSAMALALKRAELNPNVYRRIIVVIPYLSIIEQNAQVYSEIFGNDAILEHHSGSFDRLQRTSADQEHFSIRDTQQETSDTDPHRQNATENWSEPMIVTTSARFFESLFSNRPADLRRVHNIARSIVILDEIQTLPRAMLAPLLSIIRELSEKWGCTFLFATATLPAFEKRVGTVDGPNDARWNAGTMREVVQQPVALRAALNRVTIQWELDAPVTWPELASRLLNSDTVLCVVNLREHASALYDALIAETLARNLLDVEEQCFHLSTRMCAAHRLKVLAEIRRRLTLKLPCRVISTQLIEAGVDLDFPMAFRALGPLDSIFQVAGRVDREGKLTAALGKPAGRLIVFQSPDQKTPPNDYHEATMRTFGLAVAALNRNEPIQPDSVEEMNNFWHRYYGDQGADQGQTIEAARHLMNFATVAKNFEMISSRTLDVFVPFDNLSRQAIQELRLIGRITKDLRRRLQRYTVGLQPYEFEKARGVLEEIGDDSGIWAAVECAYTREKGLALSLTVEDYVL